jgi:hypothetical protein
MLNKKKPRDRQYIYMQLGGEPPPPLPLLLRLPPPPTPAFVSPVIGLLLNFFCHPLLSLHIVMQPIMLSLPAAFATNCCPPPPAPLLPLLPGCHHRHCHHGDQTHHHPLPKKEATAAAPLAYQWQNQGENVYKSRPRQLGLI